MPDDHDYRTDLPYRHCTIRIRRPHELRRRYEDLELRHAELLARVLTIDGALEQLRHNTANAAHAILCTDRVYLKLRRTLTARIEELNTRVNSIQDALRTVTR